MEDAVPGFLCERQASLYLKNSKKKKNSSGVGGCTNAVGFTSVPEEHVLGGFLDPDLESKAITHIQPSVTQNHTPQKFLRDFSPFSNVVSSF